ncbi:helix-turn-helix domain-containing protein [Serratia marcescens]|uniref:helix-turn-helix domain-containing protein n=1 Tax=Serratia marcescens TaxID=615 RepID=UPI00147CBDE7|nr:helix-turn-helix domain-containing protein [Serratia marcescens]
MHWEKKHFKFNNAPPLLFTKKEKKIQDIIVEHGREFSVEKGYNFSLCGDDKGHVFYVNRGYVSLEESEKKSIIKFFPSPLLIGIREHKIQINLSYRALSICKGYFIKKDFFLKKIKTDNLCLSLAEYIGEYCDEIIKSYALIHGENSYSMIKQCIIELHMLPVNIRKEISLANYIIKRTNLSRSGVMRIISDLCTGKYIEMRNGKLESIRHLPQAY